MSSKKSEAKSSLFSRTIVPRLAPATSAHNNGIVIKMYVDYEENRPPMHLAEFGQNFTAEKLCYKAAALLKFSPLTVPVLALKTADQDLYFAPNEKFICSADGVTNFTLRVRFIPPECVLNRLVGNALHATMLDYLFLQMRDDFIHDRIVFHEIGQEHKLGLGVIDMVRYSREHADMEWRKLDPLGFIPCSAREQFKFLWDKKRLQMNFKPHVEAESRRYEKDSVASIKLMYIKSILQYAENNYGVETFNLPSEPSVRVVVSPYDKSFPGISVHVNNEHFYCTIGDIMNISLLDEPQGRVHIDRRSGLPKIVDFADRRKALSFLSLVDGYYRLQEDYHSHLCKDVESPMLVSLRSVRCHGPVSKEWAEKRLVERYSRDTSVNYLLRQSEKEFGGFTLVYMPPQQQKPIFLQIRQVEGQFQLVDKDGREPMMSTLNELVEHYKKHAGHIVLNRCVGPSNPLDGKIYLCRADSKSTEDVSMSSQQQQKTPVCLVSFVDCTCLIDKGQFTEVWESTWDRKCDDSTITQKVAVKRLIQSNNVSQQYFSQCIHHAVFWNHPTIVTVHAVCLANPLSLIMEHADNRSLNVYLQNPKDILQLYHLILAAEQIAQAVYYLEQQHQVHGNIRCRNVLVFKHHVRGSFTVKLADPGLIHYYNSLPVNHPINMERLPWIAPECYNNLTSMTNESDLYSFGVCLWEIFSYGKRPYLSKSPDEIFQQLKRGHLDKLDQPIPCPDDIYGIITSCCDLVAESRMKPHDIIRNIRNVMAAHDGGSNNLYSIVRSNHTPSDLYRRSLSSSGALSSSSAIADNDLNTTKQQLQKLHCDVGFGGHLLANGGNAVVNAPIRQGQMLHSSNSSSVSSNGAAACDSATPLLSPGSSTAGHRTVLQSHVSCDTTTTENTSLDCMVHSDAENTGSTFVGGSPTSTSEFRIGESIPAQSNAAASIQRRPLPVPPSAISVKYEINYCMLRYDKDKPLGQGHYGEVLKGTYTNASGIVTDVAIKRLRKTMTEKFHSEFEKEFQIMIGLQHPHIVQIIGRSDDPTESMLLVMEYIANGCLREYLKQNESKIAYMELVRFCRETAAGMVYLSDAKIVHRDLATRNVLVTHDIHMKISDFGLSRALGEDRYYYKCTDDRTDLPAPWCAPEALTHRKFSEQSDVWSYGITVWEIFSFGQPPKLCEISELPQQLYDGKRLPRPKMCPGPLYQKVFRGCWEYKPENRRTFRQLAQMLDDFTEENASPTST